MSRAVINSVLGDNSYLLSIPGYDTTFPAQCITQDELTQNQEVEVVDIDNLPPHKALQYGKLRCMPNQGEYTYTPERTWLGHEDMKDFYPATLARSFFYSSEKNPRWQESCPLYRRGTVTEVIDEKYMRVKVWSSPIFEGASLVGIKCRTDYMSCDTSAFSEDDDVVVKFEDSCPEKPVVVGFWDNPQSCGWNVTLMRGDGVKITLDWLTANQYRLRIRVYDSDENLVENVSADGDGISSALTHDGDNTWTLDPSEWSDEGEDVNGYWLAYRMEKNGADDLDSITGYTQYPSIVRSSLKWNSDDLLTGGGVEDEIPYWRIEDVVLNPTPDPETISAGDGLTGSCNETIVFSVWDYLERAGYYLGRGLSFTHTQTIKASIPYKHRFYVKKIQPLTAYFKKTNCDDPLACSGGYLYGTFNVVSNKGDYDEIFTTQTVSYTYGSWSAVHSANLTGENYILTCENQTPESLTGSCFNGIDFEDYDQPCKGGVIRAADIGVSNIFDCEFEYDY